MNATIVAHKLNRLGEKGGGGVRGRKWGGGRDEREGTKEKKNKKGVSGRDKKGRG